MGGDPQRSLFCRAGADAADAGRLDLWNEFQNMPELEWPHGYFAALVLMVIVGVLPYLFFNGRNGYCDQSHSRRRSDRIAGKLFC